ncbi:ribose-5-phosphate isomerase RpiA [Gaopeijia maritima]|uniref:Ribose-5-phosphate isomerase A n=1 Tax=Gaopeijia maritima TaxID=3119007 RepID=A0ABU9E6S3_9BACT
MDPKEQLKRDAAREALSRVTPGMRLGLGTGSTMWHFVDLLGDALAEGTLSGISGVPTSERTRDQAAERGIPLLELHEGAPLDLAVDGADEVDPHLDLVKGLGGALLREKMVVQAARAFVVVADDSKEVSRLGTRAPLPIEVVPFGWESHIPALEALGARGVLRVSEAGDAVRTDNGNLLLDAHFEGGIEDPFEVENRLRARAGVVETGLFLDLADEVILASDSGLVIRRREGEA